jgi:hypothetical protein
VFGVINFSNGVINKKTNKFPLNNISDINNIEWVIGIKGISAKHKANVKLNEIFSTDSFEFRNDKNFFIKKKTEIIQL